MKLLLIFPPSGEAGQARAVSAYRLQKKYMGVIPPMSLCYVAGVAEAAGHEVQIMDANVHGLTMDEGLEQARAFGPDMIGYTMASHTFHSTLKWIKYIKSRFDVPTVVGGINATWFPEETMSHDAIDYLILGDAENLLPELMERVQRGTDVADLQSVCYRRNGQPVIGKVINHIVDFNSSPLPARHLLDNTLYSSVIVLKQNFTVMISSRGCPFRCVFCDQQGPFRPRSAQKILEEIDICYNRFGIREIDFMDSSFTVQKKRVVEICEGLKERNYDLVWTARTRVDLVNQELIKLMWDSGCRVIMYGVESSSPAVLKALNKDTNVERMQEIINYSTSVGIRVFAFFMIGSPGDTNETIKNSIRFAQELNLMYVQFTRTLPYPNTDLYNQWLKVYKRDFWREYFRDEKADMEIPSVGTDLTIEELDRWVMRAYISFYLHPRVIWKFLCDVRSLKKLLFYPWIIVQYILAYLKIKKI